LRRACTRGEADPGNISRRLPARPPLRAADVVNPSAANKRCPLRPFVQGMEVRDSGKWLTVSCGWWHG